MRARRKSTREILRETLEELTKAVQEAVDQARPKARVSAALGAWISYHSERPAEFDLGFYLGNGSQPIGVGTRLNGELNALLRRAYGIVANAMEADGAADSSNKHERSVAIVSWIFGILLMGKTGRLKTAGLNSAHLMKTCVAATGKLDEASLPSRRK